MEVSARKGTDVLNRTVFALVALLFVMGCSATGSREPLHAPTLTAEEQENITAAADAAAAAEFVKEAKKLAPKLAVCVTSGCDGRMARDGHAAQAFYGRLTEGDGFSLHPQDRLEVLAAFDAAYAAATAKAEIANAKKMAKCQANPQNCRKQGKSTNAIAKWLSRGGRGLPTERGGGSSCKFGVRNGKVYNNC